MTLIDLQAILLTGLVLASLYALMSVGLAIVWSSLRIYNFAYGALMSLGAYVAWTISDRLPVAVALSAVLAMVVLFGVGVLLEQLLVEPFTSRADISMVAIITTLAGSIFIENSIQIVWGPRLKRLEPIVGGSFDVLGTTISLQEALIILCAPLLLLLLWFLLKTTRIGMAIRAVEQNRDAAFLAGVNPRHVYALTFGISAVLAAVCGIMLGSMRFITPTMGGAPLLKAFIVVILGGLGSLGGTIASAYFVGMLEAVSTSVAGLYWTPVILFTLMIVVLIFKPSGLFGRD